MALIPIHSQMRLCFFYSALAGECRFNGILCDLPMGRMPRGFFVNDQHCLWRFVPDAKSFFDFVGNIPVFDHQDQAAGNRRIVLLKGLEVFNHPRATRTLRAMLEKQNRLML